MPMFDRSSPVAWTFEGFWRRSAFLLALPGGLKYDLAIGQSFRAKTATKQRRGESLLDIRLSACCLGQTD